MRAGRPSFYQGTILPCLIHAVMRHERLAPYRRRIAGEAAGRVLEIGAGSGLNLPFYTGRAHHVIGLDPSSPLLARATDRRLVQAAAMGPSVALLRASAEAIPLDAKSVDTVVTTWTLCSVPNARSALLEARRILKPSGRLLFVEHGRSPDEAIRRWQDRLTPVWKHVAGGCHLNRPIDTLVEECGFHIERLTTDYMMGPRLLTFMYEGSARPL